MNRRRMMLSDREEGIQIGANLFDANKEGYIAGKWLQISSDESKYIIPGNGYSFITNYMPVRTGYVFEYYFPEAALWPAIVFYDSNYEEVGFRGAGSGVKILSDIPESARFCRTSGLLLRIEDSYFKRID